MLIFLGEFSLSANTPFPGYESISLAGKFGTTSLGKQLGVSFEQNKIRRDLSVSYEQNDNVAMYHLKTPLKQYESIKLRTMMMSDMGRWIIFFFSWNCWHYRKYKKVQAKKNYEVKINRFHEILFWPNSIFCNFKIGQKSIFELKKCLKMPKMQFHGKKLFWLFFSFYS